MAGIFLIGLNNVRSEGRHDRVRPARATRRRDPGAVRLAVAAVLRRAAVVLEGRAIREVAG